jgi:hypothetical protein
VIAFKGEVFLKSPGISSLARLSPGRQTEGQTFFPARRVSASGIGWLSGHWPFLCGGGEAGSGRLTRLLEAASGKTTITCDGAFI